MQILEPPPGYQPIRTPSRKLTATPTPIGGSGFFIQVWLTCVLSDCTHHFERRNTLKMIELRILQSFYVVDVSTDMLN